MQNNNFNRPGVPGQGAPGQPGQNGASRPVVSGAVTPGGQTGMPPARPGVGGAAQYPPYG